MNNRHLSIPKGTTDVFGAAMHLREHCLGIIKRVYEEHGFEPLHTPVLEHAEVFKGHHGEGEKLLFRLADMDSTPLVLRYDLTVPLARVVSMYPNIPRPFKRYQIAQSFRDDKVDHGHFREFTQCDGDIVGVHDLMIDADIVNVAYSGLKKLGFPNFIIRLNHRGIIKGLTEYACGTTGDVLQIQRALDYADKTIKQGVVGVRKDLVERGLSPEVVERLVSIIGLSEKAGQSLDRLECILTEYDCAVDGIKELQGILELLPETVREVVSIDLTLARGADYYTGFILEAVIPGIPIGAVLGGGRYDNLVAASGGNDEPASGMAFGLDRIIAALQELGIKSDISRTTVLVYPHDDNARQHAVAAAHKLRGAGIDSDLMSCKMTLEQIESYALSRRISATVSCSCDGSYDFNSLFGDIVYLERIKVVLES